MPKKTHFEGLMLEFRNEPEVVVALQLLHQSHYFHLKALAPNSKAVILPPTHCLSMMPPLYE
jgi:hypothetical protein